MAVVASVIVGFILVAGVASSLGVSAKAYQSAQDALVAARVPGFTGTEGPTGSQGGAGFTGAQGAAGFTGAQGVLGFTGAQGLDGPTGLQGATGSQGVLGFTGAEGPTGLQGVLGFTGAEGPTGAAGDATAAYPVLDSVFKIRNSSTVTGGSPIFNFTMGPAPTDFTMVIGDATATPNFQLSFPTTPVQQGGTDSVIYSNLFFQILKTKYLSDPLFKNPSFPHPETNGVAPPGSGTLTTTTDSSNGAGAINGRITSTAVGVSITFGNSPVQITSLRTILINAAVPEILQYCRPVVRNITSTGFDIIFNFINPGVAPDIPNSGDDTLFTWIAV